MMEFSLSTMVWVPLLMGTYVIGFDLIRAIQVTTVCRDLGHMYAYGVDFTQTANQNLAYRLGSGIGLKAAGGNAVAILSSVTYIGPLQCTGAGVAADSTHCPNLNQAVIVRRLVIGDPTKRSSNFATPVASIVASDGYIDPGNYVKYPSVRAPQFNSLLAPTPGAFGYASEVYAAAPVQHWSSLMKTEGAYSNAIF